MSAFPLIIGRIIDSTCFLLISDKSASKNKTILFVTFLRPVFIAEPLPLFILCFISTTSSLETISYVLSVDPSSTTMISVILFTCFTVSITCFIDFSSLNAGITTDTVSFTLEDLSPKYSKDTIIINIIGITCNM